MLGKFIIGLLLFSAVTLGIYTDGQQEDDSQSAQENIKIEIHHCTS